MISTTRTIIEPGDTVTVEDTLGSLTLNPTTRTVTGIAALDSEGILRVGGVNVSTDGDGYYPRGVLIVNVTAPLADPIYGGTISAADAIARMFGLDDDDEFNGAACIFPDAAVADTGGGCLCLSIPTADNDGHLLAVPGYPDTAPWLACFERDAEDGQREWLDVPVTPDMTVEQIRAAFADVVEAAKAMPLG